MFKRMSCFIVTPILHTSTADCAVASSAPYCAAGRYSDLDFALVNLGRSFDVQEDELFYRHPDTPFLDRRLRGRVVRTILRGRTVFRSGLRAGESWPLLRCSRG